MRDALVHSVLLPFAAVLSAVGWFMAHSPERAFRFFTLATKPGPRVLVNFLRVCGWFFTVIFGAGVLAYLGAIAYDLSR